MEITARALWTLIHGLGFGALYLLACSGMLVELYRFAITSSSSESTPGQERFLKIYLLTMVVLAWAAVLTGAYVVYPWYRAVPPSGVTNLALYPRYLLKSSTTTAGWHDLGMEWKEHIAWIAPIAMTMVAYVLTKYRLSIREHPQIRKTVLVFALVAFGAAGTAGLFGAMLNKYAPVNGGSTIHLVGKGQ